MTHAKDSQWIDWSGVSLLAVAIYCIVAALISGCSANYVQLRNEGQLAMLNGEYGPARYLLLNAEDKAHRRVETLHDLGVCSVMVAKQKFNERNHAAAFRELDNAVAYYQRAIDEYPGHQASLEGLNIALELKGQFEEALRTAQWAADFVGPSAKQQIFLAEEYEQRGDLDAALLRYRQGVTMEPDNAKAHIAIAQFLMRHDNEKAAFHHLVEANRIDPKNQWVAGQLTSRSRPEQLATKRGATP
ncbi:MAG: hypothetical protein AAB385_04955 [Planctomycetota bacterium]